MNRPYSFAVAGACALVLAGCSATPGVVATPSARPTSAALEPQARDRVVERLTSALDNAPTGKGAAADAARADLFDGIALDVAKAEAQMSAGGAARLHERLGASGSLRVLASTPADTSPRELLLLRRTTESALPVLHVARQKTARDRFDITMSVRLLPGVAVKAFPSEAEPFTTPPGIVTSPSALVSAYAKSLDFPKPGKPVATSDPYRQSVAKDAAAQAKAIAKQATYTQAYTPVPGSTVTIPQADGGALVLTALTRTTTLTLKPNQKVNTPAVFQQLERGRKQLTKSGVVTTTVLVAMQVPSSGGPEVVGASEQLRSAKGS